MRYIVRGVLALPIVTVVEAFDEEEAAQIAVDRGVVDLCHQCGGSDEEAEEEWVLVDALNGEINEDMEVAEDE
jgi:hypothetical protein